MFKYNPASKLNFQRRHYWAIANTLALSKSTKLKRDIVLNFCLAFANDNNNFRGERFIKASCPDLTPKQILNMLNKTTL